jgi:hypothetical protein
MLIAILDPRPASAETVANRLAICKACVNIKVTTIPYIKREVEVCGLCSCPLATKSYFQSSTCPDKVPKW